MRSHVLVVTCMHTIQIIPHYLGALNDCDKNRVQEEESDLTLRLTWIHTTMEIIPQY